uniref:Uncharacterized protein n=1 Tax=Arundo donax TaxID=35708 RepID=A0A0A9H438_ARUDO
MSSYYCCHNTKKLYDQGAILIGLFLRVSSSEMASSKA